MVLTNDLFTILKKNKISFFTGVPDSILKNLSDHFSKMDKSKHIVAVNEGSAVSIGIGNYLSTKKISCVYNSHMYSYKQIGKQFYVSRRVL